MPRGFESHRLRQVSLLNSTLGSDWVVIFYFKSVQINELSNGFEPNLVLSQSMKKVENSGSFSPILVQFEDVGENFGENEKAQLSAW